MPQTPEDETFEQAEKLRDLGDPMVENADKLVRLDPKQPVWVDRENKQVVLMGEVCTAGYPLEFFATYPNRSYEAVVSVNVKPSIAHAGLLAVGAKPGRPVQFQPEFVPPSGTEIAIEIRWKDADGKAQSADAKQWVRNIRTRKALETNWVFAGSMFIKDEDGKLHYQAESGELICVLNLSTAMLDLPMHRVGAGGASVRGICGAPSARGNGDHAAAQADSRRQACGEGRQTGRRGEIGYGRYTSFRCATRNTSTISRSSWISYTTR